MWQKLKFGNFEWKLKKSKINNKAIFMENWVLDLIVYKSKKTYEMTIK